MQIRQKTPSAKPRTLIDVYLADAVGYEAANLIAFRLILRHGKHSYRQQSQQEQESSETFLLFHSN